MDEKRFYKVGGHVFSVEAVGVRLPQAGNYGPFCVAPCEDSLFSLAVETGGNVPAFVEETRQEDEGQVIVCGRTESRLPVFVFYLCDMFVGALSCSADYRSALLSLSDGGSARNVRFALDNSLMVLYSLATAKLGTALFHAAAVSYGGRGYLFLGKSGTGKSTHARLWLENIGGADLLNDDNPVVRFFEDADGRRYAKVYGSPWSGKTPCYKNEEMEVGGLVLLSQAPFNRIVPLKSVAAYAAILPCISGMRWDREIADGIHRTENALAENVPVWFLECLPDGEAARLCCGTVA